MHKPLSRGSVSHTLAHENFPGGQVSFGPRDPPRSNFEVGQKFLNRPDRSILDFNFRTLNLGPNCSGRPLLTAIQQTRQRVRSPRQPVAGFRQRPVMDGAARSSPGALQGPEELLGAP